MGVLDNPRKPLKGHEKGPGTDSGILNLKRVRTLQVGMEFKPSKCTLFSRNLEVLDQVVSSHGRIPDPTKVKVFTMATSQSAVQTFLGMIGFYRHNIPSFAQRIYHLRHLLQKGKEFHLTIQVEAEFNDLIAALTGSDVLLQFPDWSKPFHVHMDASKLGVDAFLKMQEDGLRHLRPFSYASQAFTREQELYAVKVVPFNCNVQASCASFFA